MMDFTPKPHASFAEAFEALVNERMEMDALEREPRDYLGGSRLGEACLRALGYEYHHTPKDPGRDFKGRTLRIFDRGHDGETRMAEYLRQSGFTLLTERPDGQQFGFGVAPHPETGRSRIAGHIDGVITDGPAEIGGVAIAYPKLWENKVLGDKPWNDLFRKGVERSKPVYYAQCQIYMAYLGLAEHPALFTAMNANTGAIYAEFVPFVPQAAQAASDKGVKVISAREPEELPRVAAERTDFRCKWCDWQDRCWSKPAVSAAPASTPMWFGGTQQKG